MLSHLIWQDCLTSCDYSEDREQQGSHFARLLGKIIKFSENIDCAMTWHSALIGFLQYLTSNISYTNILQYVNINLSTSYTFIISLS